MEKDTNIGDLASRNVSLRRFHPHDVWEKGARDQLQYVLVFVVLAFGFSATVATMIHQKYDAENVAHQIGIWMPFVAFAWELARFNSIGPMPDEKLQELNHFRTLHTRFSLRVLPILFALGVVWADDTRTVIIFVQECTEFAMIVWLVLTFALRRAFIKRDRNIIKAAQRFAYG